MHFGEIDSHHNDDRKIQEYNSIEIGTRDGVWKRPLIPVNFRCSSWEQIKLRDIEAKVLQEYKSWLGTATRGGLDRG